MLECLTRSEDVQYVSGWETLVQTALSEHMDDDC
jgi:hypothetical protein